MWSYNYSLHQNELYHYGVKGMKWGVRRFQREDGSLTYAGRKRYYDTPELNRLKTNMKTAKAARKKSAIAYNKALSDYHNSYGKLEFKNQVKLSESERKFKSDDLAYRKAKLSYTTDKEVARIREKGIEFKNKSKHRLKLEEQYKQLGMSDEQAQAAANNRIRTEKIVSASAAVTVTACAAYIANKKLKDRIDGVIKAGESMQRIEMRDTNGKLNEMFYVAKGTHDSQRYKNLLGATRQRQTGQAYLMKLEATKDVKVASKDHAAKAFGDLYKNDPEFRQAAERFVGAHFNGSNRANTNDVSSKNIKKMYENFNANIIDIRNSGNGADKKFYEKLKSLGYGAVQDINDMKYSGYNAKNPLIVFDGANSNIMVKSVSKITEDLRAKGNEELRKAELEQLANSYLDKLEKIGAASAVGLTAAAVGTYKTDPTKMYK